MKAIVGHILKVYEALHEAGTDEHIGDEILHIFRGKVTEAYASTGLSQGYYTQIFKQLESQGCVTYIQRGSKSVDSVIVLHHPPTPEGYRPPPKSDLTNPEAYANLQDDLRALKTLVGGVNIALALKQLEDRIARLESQETQIDLFKPIGS